MKIYDISKEMFSAEVYPGDPVPEYSRVKEIEKGDVCNLSSVFACAHNATHVDAPFHFINDGKTIDQLDLYKCVGDCDVVEISGKISKEQMLKILNNALTKKILLKGTLEITIEAAKVLTDFHTELIGVEKNTVGEIDTSPEIHRILLKEEIFILENIDLSGVEAGNYFLYAAPVKYGCLDGAPCRALLIEK